MSYAANRGGHAPGHLRDALQDYFEGGRKLIDLAETLRIGDEEKTRPLRWLIGQLWNCTDTMPGALCGDLDLPQGSTYAQGVRDLAGRAHALGRAQRATEQRRR